jgi:hypothetical protein
MRWPVAANQASDACAVKGAEPEMNRRMRAQSAAPNPGSARRRA